MKNRLSRIALLSSCLLLSSQLLAEPKRPECIAPAKPGGGFDLTCKLAQSGLKDSGLLEAPMRVTYMPGGVGAVAYNAVVAQRADEPGTITAFSSGSLLNLAQGKFGRYDENAVRWLAAVGTDYGAISVRADAPYKNLDELIAAVKKDPGSVVFGAGATIGGQDWMQTALPGSIRRSCATSPSRVAAKRSPPCSAVMCRSLPAASAKSARSSTPARSASLPCSPTSVCRASSPTSPRPRNRATTSAGR